MEPGYPFGFSDVPAPWHRKARRLCAALLSALLTGCATQQPAPLSADVLAHAMLSRPVVLLGEVHDNAAQHAVRAEALRRLLASGPRPVLAFEQFDRDRQQDLDRARGEALPPGVERVDHLIARGGGSTGWNWNLYRPYLQLALEHDLPIVAANLSRSDAMRIAQQGFAAFDPQLQAVPRLEQLPAWFVAEHERAVDIGHCKLMPRPMLSSLARAQIARDLALAQAIRPHIARGVVLLTGNGHARNDIGVPYFLTPAERVRTMTIGLLESDGEDASEAATHFDVVMLTPRQPRVDPCAALRERLPQESVF